LPAGRLTKQWLLKIPQTAGRKKLNHKYWRPARLRNRRWIGELRMSLQALSAIGGEGLLRSRRAILDKIGGV